MDDAAVRALIDRARVLYQNDDCEIDDNAAIAESAFEDGRGAWVQAWVWVPAEE